MLSTLDVPCLCQQHMLLLVDCSSSSSTLRCDVLVYTPFSFMLQLYQPMPIMIWAAIIIFIGVQSWIDMGILLAIQFINAFLGW